jgi:D-alanyl-D-alanine carboxypeptidase
MRRFLSAVFLLALIVSSRTSLYAQTAGSYAAPVDKISTDLSAKIDAVANKVLNDTGVPSASVAIVQKGQIVYTQAYGKARLEPLTTATPQMRYSIGSISKQFTAAAILLLQQQGKLSIDDPVSKYIPGAHARR